MDRRMPIWSHDEAITAYVGNWQVNTIRLARTSHTSYGAVVNISSGDYGRRWIRS